MGNSTTKLQSVVDFARTYPELNPVLAMGGFSQEPALTIANDVMIAMLSKPYSPKWNEFKYPFFYTNSFQQDYAFNVNNLAWLQEGVMVDINSTSQPKNKYTLETNRYLPETSVQYGYPGQVCWAPNDQMIYATWGGGNLNEGSLSNPGPGSTYGPLISNIVNGVLSQPANPIDQIVDPNGNFWRLSNYISAPSPIVLGSTQPTWPTVIQYPTATQPNITATTQADGTGIWTAINPKGQGLRVNPIPSQQGRVFQGRIVAQLRAPMFTSLSQTLEPIPDDFAGYFRRGFIAYSYMHHKDPKVRAKFLDQQKLWIESLQVMIVSTDRERDNAGIFPSDPIMTNPGSAYLGPAAPYQNGGY